MKAGFILAFLLGGVLSGCSTRPIPSAPSSEQVREWAGFPNDFPLQAQVQSMTNLAYDSKSMHGKAIWIGVYQNPERSLVTLAVSIYEPGSLWGTNRARLQKMIEENIAKTRTLKNPREFEKTEQIVTLPNGRKAYFSVLGFGPGAETFGGFSYERGYDLLVEEDFSTEDGVPAEKQIKNPLKPANDLTVIFSKIEAFLESQ